MIESLLVTMRREERRYGISSDGELRECCPDSLGSRDRGASGEGREKLPVVAMRFRNERWEGISRDGELLAHGPTLARVRALVSKIDGYEWFRFREHLELPSAARQVLERHKVAAEAARKALRELRAIQIEAGKLLLEQLRLSPVEAARCMGISSTYLEKLLPTPQPDTRTVWLQPRDGSRRWPTRNPLRRFDG